MIKIKIAEAYAEISVKTAPFKKQLSGLETATKKTTQNIQQRFQTLAPTFRKVGIGMAVAGGAITAALGLTIKSAMSFNKEMANIATLIPGATERVIELKTAIRGMAVVVGKSTADLAQGAYQVISAFGDTADTVNILEMSAKAATAGVATTTEAINLLSAVTKGYGDTSKEAVKKASDLAFQTVTLGQTTFPELAASIGRAIPLAAELGVVEEELFTVMATGTGVTGKAAEVSTQLRGIFQSLMAPTADMTKLLEKMGYESGKAMLAEEGLHGALLTIVKAAKDSNTPLQKYISQIEGQTLALALTGAQSDVYIEKLAKMRDSVGLTDIAFREQTEGINKAGFAFEQAKIRIGVLGQEIGDRLLPMITPLIEKITDLVKKMSDWAKEHPKLSSGIVKFAAVLGPLLIGLGALLMILPGLVSIAPLVGAAFTIMTGPIGIIVAAIGAAVAAFLYFYKTSDKFANVINNIGAHIKAFVQNAWNRLIWLKDNWGKLWKTIFEAIPKIAKNSFDNLMAIFNWVWDFIKGWGSWLGKNFINIWKNMFGAISTSVKNFGDNIWAQLKWIGEKMKPKNWFKKIERPDWTPLLEGFEAVWEEMPKIAELQLKKLTETVENFMEPLPKLVKPVLQAVKEGAEGVAGAIDDVKTATESYITVFDKLQKIQKKASNEEEKRRKEIIEANAERRNLLERIAQIEKEIEDKVAAAAKVAEEIKRNERIKTNAERRKLLERIAQIEKEIESKVAMAVKVAEDIKRKIRIETNADRRKLLERIAQIEKDSEDKVAAAAKVAEDIKRKETIETNAQRRKLLDRIAQIEKEIENKVAKAVKVAEEIKRKERIKTNAQRRNLLIRIAKIEKENEDKVAAAAKVAEEIKRKEVIKTNAERRKLLERIAQIEKEIEDKVAKAAKVAEDIKRKERIKTNKERRNLLERIAQIEKQIENKVAAGVKVAEEIKRNERIKTNAERRKLLERIAQIEKATADKVVKINWDEVQKMYHNWKGFFDDVEGLSIDSLADFALYWSSLTDEQKKALEDLIEATTKAGDRIKSAFGVATTVMGFLTDAIKGTKEGFEALETAFLSLISQIPLIGGLIASIYELGKALGIVKDRTEEETIEMLRLVGVFDDSVLDLMDSINILESVFEDMGMTFSGSIEKAEKAIKSLMQTQEDLALSTREKLIKELDNYYDYRVLREMDLTELLALSVETREKLEKGTLESIAETAEEVAEREKDAKVGTLQAIENAYAKESVLIDKKIALLEIEIKLLMAAALAEQGKLKEAEKLRQEAIKSLEDLQAEWEGVEEATEKTTKAAKEYGKEGERSANDVRDAFGRTRGQIEDLEDSTNQARIGIEQWGEDGRRNAQKITEGLKEARIGIELWSEEINRIPRRIDFDIVGDLHMPSIPHINPRYFDVIGEYRAPNIPSYQVGIPYVPRTQVAVIHKKEAVLTAPQAEDWRAGGGGAGTGGNTFNTRILNTGDLRSDVDLELFVRKVADRITETMRRT